MQSPVADAFPPRPIALPKIPANLREQPTQSVASPPIRAPKPPFNSTSPSPRQKRPHQHHSGNLVSATHGFTPYTEQPTYFPHLRSVSRHSPPLRPQLTKFSWVSFPPRQRRHHYHAPSIHEHITKTPITFSAPTHPPSFITPFHPRIPQPGRKIMDTIAQYLRWSAPAISFYP
jgi:hypothetical protein